MSHTLTTDARGAVAHCDRSTALEQRLACLADGGPAAIDARLAELDRECSAGRMAKAALGVVIVVGSVLAAVHSSWWLILPGVAAVFLIQYTLGRYSWMTAALTH